jgi:membrane protein YqaA with SNARE-associated domain
LNALKTFLAKYTAFFNHAVLAFGVWGPFTIAAVDSAAFGIPLDLAMASYAWQFRASPTLLVIGVLMGAAGSVVGSLVPFWVGRKGGEPLLLKKVSHERLESLRDRYENWEFLFVMIPSMLPPPTPMKLLIFAVGAFEMRTAVFSAAIFLGRLLRFAPVTYLTVRFGESLVRNVAGFFVAHKAVLSVVLIGGFIAVVWVVWRKLFGRDGD